ncbi:hypothetical protein PMAYCL1PPCAC_14515, partial [Pristionchus mayeri]
SMHQHYKLLPRLSWKLRRSSMTMISLREEDGKRRQKTEDGAVIHSKFTSNGKMVTASAVVEGSVDAIIKDAWERINKAPLWDSNINFESTFVSLTNHSDSIQYGSNQILILSGREILAARLYRPLP